MLHYKNPLIPKTTTKNEQHIARTANFWKYYERIEYKRVSLAFKAVKTTQPAA